MFAEPSWQKPFVKDRSDINSKPRGTRPTEKSFIEQPFDWQNKSLGGKDFKLITRVNPPGKGVKGIVDYEGIIPDLECTEVLVTVVIGHRIITIKLPTRNAGLPRGRVAPL